MHLHTHGLATYYLPTLTYLLTYLLAYLLTYLFATYRFFPAEEAHAERFVTNLAASELSMALLQSYFMLYRDSAEQVRVRVRVRVRVSRSRGQG